MEQQLLQYLRGKLLHLSEVAVSGLRQMTEGYSYLTYAFRVEGWQGEERFSRELVVRMEPEHGPVPPYDVSRQFIAIKGLQDTPVPVPRVYWLEQDPAVLGRPFFVMEKVEGEVPLPWRTGHPTAYDDPEQRARMADDFVQALADLHTQDWRALGLEALGVPQDETAYARSELRRWEQVLQENQLLPQPILWEALRWLKAHLPAAEHTTIVHGDYRLGNFIWRDGSIAAFLDWEMVGLGDPMSDMGWVCMKRLRGRSPLLVGLIEREEFLRRYQELTGFNTSEESLYFWQVMGYFKLGAIHLAGIRACADQLKQDIRLAIWEFDLPLLLNELCELLEF